MKGDSEVRLFMSRQNEAGYCLNKTMVYHINWYTHQWYKHQLMGTLSDLSHLCWSYHHNLQNSWIFVSFGLGYKIWLQKRMLFTSRIFSMARVYNHAAEWVWRSDGQHGAFSRVTFRVMLWHENFPVSFSVSCYFVSNRVTFRVMLCITRCYWSSLVWRQLYRIPLLQSTQSSKWNRRLSM